MSLYKTPGSGFLEASKMKLAADIKEAEAKIQLYLSQPVGVGDHPDIAQEILKAAAAGAHAVDLLNFLNERWPECS
jgi:hypothetical protein